MPTARSLPSVLSLQSALVVAGGCDPNRRIFTAYFFSVEIFKPDTSQWCIAEQLPKACCNPSLTAIGNTCYALGGYKSNLALYASVDNLFHNAVPANQTTNSGPVPPSVWKVLPNTPTLGPAAAVLAGNFLAVGGDKSGIYLYCSQTESWAYIGSLPCDSKDFDSTTGFSSLLDILVIANGGNSVYKGTPSLFKCN